MKKLTYFFLAAIVLVFASCDKTGDGDLVDATASGKLNGSSVDFTTIFSDFSTNSNLETAYITMRKDFEGFDKPATNGKQLLIRIEPYTGPGTYTVNSGTFWVFSEEITKSGDNYSWTLHRFTHTEKVGSMKVVITEDAIKQGKRTLIGNFEGKNGITEKSTFLGSQVQPFKTMEFNNLTFVAPKVER